MTDRSRIQSKGVPGRHCPVGSQRWRAPGGRTAGEKL